MAKFRQFSDALLNITLSITRLWYAILGLIVIMAGLLATGAFQFGLAAPVIGVLLLLLVGILFPASAQHRASLLHDKTRQGYVERFGSNSHQVRLYDDVVRGEIQQAFRAVRVWLFFPYAGLFVIATIFGSLAQYITTDERTAQASIVPILVTVLLVAAGIVASRNRALQLEYSMGFIRRAMMEQDYPRAVRYADEMIRRNPTEEARLQAALTCILANDLSKAEKYVRASLQTLMTQPASTRRRSPLRHQQLSFAQSILGIIHIAQRDYDTAESLLLKALQDDPRNTLALVNYAEVLLWQGSRWQEALEIIRTAEEVRIQGKRPPVASHAAFMAWSYALGGQHEQVADFVQDALVIAGVKQTYVMASVHYLHGLMQLSMGDAAEAHKAFGAAQNIDPNGLYGYLAKAKLAELLA